MFRSVLMGLPLDYDDNDEGRNTHLLLLSKAEAEGVISRQNIEVLKLTTGSIWD